MAKSPDAFRTISEVADWLGVQAHVLRFWESKFAQVKPIKRAGGRRYYRPSDMLLLGGLKRVLHEDGMTIKGAQKLLREKGVGYVADMSQPLDDLTIAVIEGSSAPVVTEDALSDMDVEVPELSTEGAAPEIESELESLQQQVEPEPQEPTLEPATATSRTEPDVEPDDASQDLFLFDRAEAAATPTDDAVPSDQQPDLPLEAIEAESPAPTPDPQDVEPAPMVSFRARPRDVPSAPPPETQAALEEPQTEPEPEPDEKATTAPAEDAFAPVAASPKPNRVNVTLVHDHTTIEVDPSALSALSQIRSLSPEDASGIRPLLARLTRLRASMASPRKEQRKD